MRFTLAVKVAMDGIKPSLFVIFKDVPGGRVEKSLPETIPEGVIGCVQRKAWMDNRTMCIWQDYVYKPYVTGTNGRSGLLLDDFKCHRSPELLQAMEDDNAHGYMIPTHYTGMLQPCDVGINKPLKDRLKQKFSDWRSEKHTELRSGELMPSPSRKDMVGWVKKIWDEFPIKIVKNSFTGSGYFFEDTIDYSGDTESEFDEE